MRKDIFVKEASRPLDWNLFWTIVAKSAIKVWQQWTGNFSNVFLVAALVLAFFGRLDGAT